MNKEDLEIFIRDIGLWESGGTGETLWIISIDGLPDWFRERYSDEDHSLDTLVFELSPEEVGQLGLEQAVKEDYESRVQEYGKENEFTLEAREIMAFGVSAFLRDFDVPERIKAVLMHIPDEEQA